MCAKKRKRIWIRTALICIGLTIVGDNVYAKTINKSEGKNMDHQHHSSHSVPGASEVKPFVSYNNGELVIELKDENGKLPELKVSHEKIMHLIFISSDLKAYHHLHPEEKGNRIYVQKLKLPNDDYKVFIDINPKDLMYKVGPVTLSIGGIQKDPTKNKLVAETDFTKTINGRTVELITEKIEVNKEVTFNFDVKDAKPDPYLGALGHVVITDEVGEKFIHVHPLSEDETVFVTQFDEVGMYKM